MVDGVYFRFAVEHWLGSSARCPAYQGGLGKAECGLETVLGGTAMGQLMMFKSRQSQLNIPGVTVSTLEDERQCIYSAIALGPQGQEIAFESYRYVTGDILHFVNGHLVAVRASRPAEVLAALIEAIAKRKHQLRQQLEYLLYSGFFTNTAQGLYHQYSRAVQQTQSVCA